MLFCKFFRVKNEHFFLIEQQIKRTKDKKTNTKNINYNRFLFSTFVFTLLNYQATTSKQAKKQKKSRN